MTATSPTTPPPADPTQKAFEEISAKMDQFNSTMTACHDLLVELRDWQRKTDERIAALESIPPPSQRNGVSAS
jgi:hypothetical protein